MTAFTVPDHLPQVAAGTGDGVDKLCAMQYSTFLDEEYAAPLLDGLPISAFPHRSARPLARMVQVLNDALGDPDTGYLTAEDSALVRRLGDSTLGTAAATPYIEWTWLADALRTADITDGRPGIDRIVTLAEETAADDFSAPAWKDLANGIDDHSVYPYAAAGADRSVEDAAGHLVHETITSLGTAAASELVEQSIARWTELTADITPQDTDDNDSPASEAEDADTTSDEQEALQ